MRYIYLGDRMTKLYGSCWTGQTCDPVRDTRGKCIVCVNLASALVIFGCGTKVVVPRRRLRLLSKLT